MWANFTGKELNYFNILFIFSKLSEKKVPCYVLTSSLFRRFPLFRRQVNEQPFTLRQPQVFETKHLQNSPILLKVANYFFLGFMDLYCCYSIKFTTSLNKNKSKLFQVKFNIPGAVKRKEA